MTTLSLHRSLAAALFLTAIVGCGAAPAPTPQIVYPNISGDWQFDVETIQPNPPPIPPVNIQMPILDLFGSLASSNSRVTGILNASTGTFPACIANNADIAVTGTVAADGTLSLTAPIAGGVLTLFLPPNTNQRPFGGAGAYQVEGGACAQPQLPLNGFSVPNGSGTYTGTLTPALTPTTGSLTITATLLQATNPNADGQYPVTGIIAYSGDCTGTLTITNGLVYGDQFQSSPFTLNFGVATERFTLPLPFSPGPINSIASFIAPAGCASGLYHGTLDRQ